MHNSHTTLNRLPRHIFHPQRHIKTHRDAFQNLPSSLHNSTSFLCGPAANTEALETGLYSVMDFPVTEDEERPCPAFRQARQSPSHLFAYLGRVK
ncbi:hypothetical protein E2C01_083746 [Portunus trituberculatus]|uniref:Uncharacterized protein n=1 Tax=Portunus trituberculatus TaxID=210409 RepID=A0A5B7J237_PORTR|nr:hypothetical protein [Portunus trituberculatus]